MCRVLGKFAREAATALLRLAKSTSDPNIAAALVHKAADMKERIEEVPIAPSDTMAEPQDAQDAE